MKNFFLIFLILILVTACTSNKPTRNLDKEEYYILRGINLSQEGKYLEALQEYKKAYAKESKNPITLREMGLVYGELGNLEKAEEFYEKAIKEDKNDQVSYKNLALINYSNEDYDKAEEYLDMVSKDSVDILTLKLKGLIAAKKGEREAAYKILNEAILMDTYLDIELYTVYGQVMIDEKKFMELYQTLEDGYSEYEDDRSYILFYTSFLSERFGENKKSERILKRYMAEYGGGDLVYMQLAKICLAADNGNTARKSIEMVSDRYRYDVGYLNLRKQVMEKVGNAQEVEKIEKLIKQMS